MPSRPVLPAVLAVLICVPAASQSSYADAFESSALNGYWTLQQNSGSVVFPSTVQVHGGTQCVQFSTINTGIQKGVHLKHDFLQPTYGSGSVWVYDTGADLPSSNYLSFGTSVANITACDYDLGPSNCGTYSATPAGSASFFTGVDRTQGWHQLAFSSTPVAQTLAIDGTAVFSGPGGFPFMYLYFAMYAPAWRPAWVSYWDDFVFQPYAPAAGGQINSDCASLVINGVGAGGQGPFTVLAPAGGTLTLDWSGAAFQPYGLVATPAFIPGQQFGGSLVVDVDVSQMNPLYTGLDAGWGFLFFTNGVNGAYGTATQSFGIPPSAAGAMLKVQGLVWDATHDCSGAAGLMTTASFALQF